MQSDSGILSERSGNLSSVTRAKANAILDQVIKCCCLLSCWLPKSDTRWLTLS